MAKTSSNWSWDGKKIHILIYLIANNEMGGIRATFLRMTTKGINSGMIGTREIKPILEELIDEKFIELNSDAGGDVYRSSQKGIDFIEGLKSLKEKFGTRFLFLDTLDEPTDAVPRR